MYKGACINYINSKVFVKALTEMEDLGIDLINVIPSKTIEHYLNDDLDFALVPVAALAELENYEYLCDYCISSNGKVHSVCLCSDTPLQHVREVFLDDHSRTSNCLARILMSKYENLTFCMAQVNDKKLDYGQAKVMIGDKAMNAHKEYSYVFDLAEAWTKHMELPFVFAVWICKPTFPLELRNEINVRFKEGLAALDSLIVELKKSYPQHAFLNTYLKKHIQYDLTEEKRKAIAKFLGLVKGLPEIALVSRMQ